MQPDLDHLLDECLALVQEGRATISDCLARYPDQAALLKPLLESADSVRRMVPPTTTRAVFEAGKARMLAAVHRHHSRPRSWFTYLSGAHGRQRVRRVALIAALALLLATTASLSLYLASQYTAVVKPINPLPSHPTSSATPWPTTIHEPTASPRPSEQLVSPLPSTTRGPTEPPEVTQTPKPTEPPEATESPEPTHAPEPTEPPEGTESPEPTDAPEPTEPPEEAEEPDPTNPPEPTRAPEPTEAQSPSPTRAPGGIQ